MANKELTICLDAGHYGKYNQSPAVKSYYESDMVWKLHLLQKKYLEQYGFKVITTRENQATDLALYTRGATAKGCALFISNHSNAVGSYVNDSVDYVSVYRLYEDTTTNCDDISKEIAEVLAPVIAEQMGVSQGYRVVTRKSDNDRNGDGIMNDNYYGVLNGARAVNVPGMILEHSFHTNTRTTNWLLDDSNLDKLAQAEAAAIAKYFGMAKQANVEKTDEKTVEKDTEDGVLYRVQVGAYHVRANAEAQLARVKAAGFDAFITTVKVDA